ncbi:prepilin-type N-terminal cleavage/methylation domain-containing protein [Halobacillus sp. A1]|uniref:prepilin-type N-terminal cleavage/methylation domain-containing protein n=1 Tax=Halobacillus sp. A1 TaxID=2880262 RepID=UPI0020A666D0|nr:prepilin-type N-terminal cleavage/methylation domain-containing protein [Halobacillus sp. A1]MCP3030471.1 prepilin-type N-terminal cleavage/methylation domain-containing protein [Halobacillus sp. A1]
MRQNFLNNNRGVTLIELLAALAFAGIILTITGSFFVQSINSSSSVESQIDLKQQSNLLLSQIREETKNQPAEICFDNELQLYVNNDRVLSNEHIYINELYIENGNISLSNPGDCINTTTESPISIGLTVSTTEQNSSDYKTSTVIMPRSSSHLKVEVKQNEKEEPENIFTTSEQFEDLSVKDGEPYQRMNSNGNGQCHYEDSVSLLSITFASWTSPCLHTTFAQFVHAKQGFSMNGTNGYRDELLVEIGESLYVDGYASIQQGTLKVSDNIQFNNQFNLNSGVIEGNNVHFKNNTNFNNNFTLQTSGSTRFDQAMTSFSNGTFNIGGYLFSNNDFRIGNNVEMYVSEGAAFTHKVYLLGNADLYAGGSIDIRGKTQFQNNASMSSGGNITFHSQANLNGNSSVKSEGNITFNETGYFQNNTSLIAKGDIIFRKNIGYSDGENEFICAEGEVIGKEYINGPHTIEEGGSCPF